VACWHFSAKLRECIARIITTKGHPFVWEAQVFERMSELQSCPDSVLAGAERLYPSLARVARSIDFKVVGQTRRIANAV
jgi:hypothetical protein